MRTLQEIKDKFKEGFLLDISGVSKMVLMQFVDWEDLPELLVKSMKVTKEHWQAAGVFDLESKELHKELFEDFKEELIYVDRMTHKEVAKYEFAFQRSFKLLAYFWLFNREDYCYRFYKVADENHRGFKQAIRKILELAKEFREELAECYT